YMAPEQIEGGDKIDARADLFALSVLIAESLGILEKRLSVRLTGVISELAPGIPQALHRLLLRMNAIDADARPRSAKEVLHELAAIRREVGGGMSLAQVVRPHLPIDDLIGAEDDEEETTTSTLDEEDPTHDSGAPVETVVEARAEPRDL